MMSVTRLTSSEAVRAVVGPQVETMAELAEEVERRLVDWEREVAGLVRERLRLGGELKVRDQAWAENRKLTVTSLLFIKLELTFK